MFTTAVGAVVAASLTLTLAAAPAPRNPELVRQPVFAPRAMAATSQPLATQAALDVLRAGGTAVDAAIAANACLGLMEPTGCGVGGDLFAIVWDPTTAKLHGYNGSGRAPAGLTLELLRARGIAEIPQAGPLPVTVPGCVDGWFALHGRFGKLPMTRLLAPAIGYAEGGFPLSPVIADAWATSVKRHGERPNFRATFTLDGKAPAAGQTWRNAALAATYRRIAETGRDGFYKGELPAAVEAFMRTQQGVLAASDFAAHTGEWVEPVSVPYRGCEVWELPPNGQGIAALQMLRLLETYDLRAMGFGSAEHLHTLIEAKKLAFEDRARLYADPAFAPAPVKHLLSAAYAAERRALIDPARAAQRFEPASIPAGADTIYLCVADESGMMVSLIQSNYRGMGSGMVPAWEGGASMGFMLQNRGEQFATVPGHPNVLAPGKRPFHTIIPGFLTKDGQPLMAFGVMGGAMQPQGHVQIICNMLDFGMNIQEAGDAPRVHHDGSTEPAGAVAPMTTGGIVNLEPGFAPAVAADLTKRGHTLRPAPAAVFGGYQAIMRLPGGGYVGATETRKDGQAAGY